MLALCYSCRPWQFVLGRTLGPIWKRAPFSIGVARLREVSPPPLPAGWAMVRVRQCGLCASDVHLIRLHFSPFITPVIMAGDAHGPGILGHELVGTVEQAAGGNALPVGTRVISRSGGFRNCFNRATELCPQCRRGEYALCLREADPPPAHEPLRGGGFASLYWEAAENLLAVPENLSDDTAMLAEPLACSLRAVLRLANSSPARVLVIGAGLQGLGAVHWLRNLRPQDEVTCLARHGFQADLARALGAPQVLTGHIGAPELAQRLGTTCIKGLAGNDVLLDGFDAVIDSIGTPQTLQSALRWTRPGGQVVILGVHLAAGTLDYSPVWYRQVQLCGVMAHGMEMFEGRQVPTLQLALELLASRAPLPVNLVTHRVALREFPSALEIYDNRRSAAAVRVAICPA